MTTERLHYLLEKRHTGLMSAAEQLELDNWYQAAQDSNAPLYNGKDIEKENVIKAELSDLLMKKIDAGKRRPVIRMQPMMQRWAIAASVLLIIAAIAYFDHTGSDRSSATSLASTEQKGSSHSSIVYLENTGATKKQFHLPDSSKITLSPESRISYNFDSKSRSITLQGEAYFSVQSNPLKPFSVAANGIRVTALGTSFTINSFDQNNLMKVNLHEGRVMVQTDSLSAKRKMKTVYLQPGDLLSIHPVTLANTVKHLPSVKTPQAPVLARIKPASITPATMKFEQEPLATVLNKLATHYHILITYDQQQIRDLDFSGTLRLPDSIPPVLQRIAILNGLTVTLTNKGYHIEKN